MSDKNKYIESFKKLKSEKGNGRISIQDIMDDMGVKVPEPKKPAQSQEEINTNFSIFKFISEGGDFSIIHKYHEKAQKNNVENLSDVNPINGKGIGFSYTQDGDLYEIYYEVGSDCVVEEINGDEDSIHEIGLYEFFED